MKSQHEITEETKRELTRCGIPIVPYEHTIETYPTVMGKLGPFEIRDLQRGYWRVTKGRVPYYLAKDLYEHPVGRTDIRVAGHCMCPPPEEPYLEFWDANGVQWLPEKERIYCERYVRECTSSIKEIAQGILDRCKFSDNRWNHALGYVTQYDIDSELGLYIFAEAIKRAGLIT